MLLPSDHSQISSSGASAGGWDIIGLPLSRARLTISPCLPADLPTVTVALLIVERGAQLLHQKRVSDFKLWTAIN
jgi:hypothetical protein